MLALFIILSIFMTRFVFDWHYYFFLLRLSHNLLEESHVYLEESHLCLLILLSNNLSYFIKIGH
jgi:hypothetical protein